jgi:hypothetical protein
MIAIASERLSHGGNSDVDDASRSNVAISQCRRIQGIALAGPKENTDRQEYAWAGRKEHPSILQGHQISSETISAHRNVGRKNVSYSLSACLPREGPCLAAWNCLAPRAVRSPAIVIGYTRRHRSTQMGLAGDEQVIEALGPC